MPKGDGSSRIVSLSADVLEGRMLLSHVSTVATVHALSGKPSTPVATTTVATKTDVEPAHSASTSPGDVEQRDAEEVAAAAQAASSIPNPQYTLPLVLSTAGDDPGEGSNVSTAILGSSKILRVSYSDEPVAWGSGISSTLRFVRLTRHTSELTPETPEILTAPGTVTGPERTFEPRQEDDEPVKRLATKGADLLAPYLPFDRAAVEQAIDRLIDGIEVLGDEITGDGESAELIPLPIAWGLGLATVEIVRRRLRARSDAEGDDRLERDPALGLRD